MFCNVPVEKSLESAAIVSNEREHMKENIYLDFKYLVHAEY